jgi:signal transduction histidine kinase
MVAATRIRQAWVRLRRRKARRRAVHEFRRSLAIIVDRDALEASVATRLKEIFDPDRLAILQLDPRAGQYRLSFSSGFEDGTLEGAEIAVRGRLTRWFLVNESCLLLPRDRGVLDYLETAERELLERLDVQLAAPLLARNHLLGVVLLGSSRPERLPDRHDAELLLALLEQASLAFQNATLYREQQERLERLHRADRLAAIGQLAAGVAHEVRNPLTAIRSTMQYLGHGYEDGDPKQELARELIDEVDRIDSTIAGLLSLTRSGELRPAEVDLVALLRQTARLMEIQARKQSVAIEESYPPTPLVLQGDAAQLKQVFLNLILNALQAMPEGGLITLEAELVDAASGTDREKLVNVRVADDGPGIPRDRLGRVFDPFYTTKPDGTGLGLAICYNIVQRHKGEMEIVSAEGEGTSVSIFLPLKT